MADHDIVIVGAGPVGMIAALDLAYRGINVLVLEQRSDDDPMHSRCNTTSARTMEALRRVGCSGAYRKTGLPPDFSTDVLYTTRVNGIEITRYNLASSRDRFENDRFSHDGGWRSAERPHRSSQMYLEKVLRMHARSQDNIELRFFHEVTAVEQSAGRAQLSYRNALTGDDGQLSARFIIACDGGRSQLRRNLGIKMVGGNTGIGRTQSIFFRSKELMGVFSTKPG